jgi:hypothetical protein
MIQLTIAAPVFQPSSSDDSSIAMQSGDDYRDREDALDVPLVR